MQIDVNADYSSFYLRGARLEYDRATAGTVPSSGLVDGDDESVRFTVFRQYGKLPIDVEVLESEPIPLNGAWQDVVEFSITSREGLSLAGWDPSDLGAALGVDAGTNLRGRYAVADADRAHFTFEPPYPEKYQLRFWPAPLTPMSLTKSQSAAGEYWNFQFQANAAKVRALEAPEGERTRAIVRMAFQDHPESVARIASGDDQFATGIIAYAQKIYPAEFEHNDLRLLVISTAKELAAGAH